MTGRGRLTIAFALAGTVALWLPILAPLALSLVRTSQTGRLRIDYLMPAELFPVALIGGALLLWASLRARLLVRPVIWSLVVMTGTLVTSMAVATATGLASGAAEPEGWRLAVVFGLLAAYVISMLVLAVAGVSMLRRLLRTEPSGGLSQAD